jgi:hypothetical protein
MRFSLLLVAFPALVSSFVGILPSRHKQSQQGRQSQLRMMAKLPKVKDVSLSTTESLDMQVLFSGVACCHDRHLHLSLGLSAAHPPSHLAHYAGGSNGEWPTRRHG